LDIRVNDVGIDRQRGRHHRFDAGDAVRLLRKQICDGLFGCGHISPLFICSARYSEARHESAIIQVVMPCVPGKDTKQLPSVTKRFLMACDWQNELSTEVFGSFPIRAEPHSCVASPIGSIYFRCGRISAPHARRICSIHPYISCIIFLSFSLSTAWKRACGMPYASTLFGSSSK